MVNCIVAGNSSTKQGGGVFNSKHTVNTDAGEIYMHNCLIVGNEADGAGTDDIGGGVFNGLGSDPAIMELIQCTLVGNHAGYRYGGAVNNSTVGGSKLHVRNSIVRGNTDADVHTACTAAVLALKTHVGSLTDRARAGLAADAPTAGTLRIQI